MKLLIKVVLVLILLVVIGAVAGFMVIDKVAKSAVEKSATDSLGVPTTLASGDVKVFSSEFTMGGVKVANPEGFDGDHFLTINDGGVSVSLKSLMEDVVELPTLTFTGLDVNLQKTGAGSNFGIILDNLKGEESEPAEPNKKKFIIRTVKIQDINVHADLLPIGGQLTKTDLHIDEIVLTDVGSGGNGVKLSEVSTIVMKAIMAAIISKGGALPGELANELGSKMASLRGLAESGVSVAVDALGDITGGVGDALKGAGNITNVLDKDSDIGKAVDEGVGGLLKGAGGILGGNKDKDGEK